jgi:hypothetical protein
MKQDSKNTGLTRREFVKGVGLAGLAAGTGAIPALAAEPKAGAPKAATVPKRKLGKTGVDVSISFSSRPGIGESPTGTPPRPTATA